MWPLFLPLLNLTITSANTLSLGKQSEILNSVAVGLKDANAYAISLWTANTFMEPAISQASERLGMTEMEISSE